MTKTSTFAVARDEVKDLWMMIGGLDRQVKETQKIEKALKDSANSHTAALETKVSHASPNLQHIKFFDKSVRVCFLTWQLKEDKKFKFVYSIVTNPQEWSKDFILYSLVKKENQAIH